MLINIQNPQSKKTFGSFCLLLMLSFFLTQCGKSSKQTHNATQTPDGGFALTLPSELRKHQSGKNITAQLVVDEGTPINMTVDLDSDQVTASTGPLSPGSHRFVIQYFLDGALIATATSQAQIIAGQNTNIIFTPDLTVNVTPSVLATQPIANATGVVVNSSVSATFSQPMDATSIVPLNFTLGGLTGSIAGAVTYNETPPSFEARFTPTQSLALAANYTANLSTGITGILGEPLTAAQSWMFTTADGSWGNVEGVDDNSGSDNAASPQIAVNANGNAIAVWVQTDLVTPGPNNIWGNRYLKGVGWGTPRLIETDNAGNAAAPQVAIDSNDNAFAVWHQHDGTRNNIWVNRFDPSLGAGGDWEGEKLLEAGTGDALSPQVAMDSNGNAIAIWSQIEGAFTNIVSKRFVSGSDWGSPVPVDSASTIAEFPQIAINANGDATAVWIQADSAVPSIFANRFDINTLSWGIADRIEFDNAGAAGKVCALPQICPIIPDGSPQIEMDDSGKAIAVWLQDDGSNINVVSNRFIPSVGWDSLPQDIDTASTEAFSPSIALDPQGNAFAVWRQFEGAGFHIFSNQFNGGTGLWGTPTPLEIQNASNIGFPQVTLDLNGNAISIWTQRDTGEAFDNVWASRYTPNTGWKTAEKIEQADSGDAIIPQVGLDSAGNVISVWIQFDGTTINVYSNRFQ